MKPHAQLANNVAVNVRITAAPTITASRRPKARPTSTITDAVAKASFLDQLVGLLGRGLAVVARDRQLHAVGRQHGVAQFVQPIARGARHLHRVLARLLGDRDRQRGCTPPAAADAAPATPGVCHT